MQQTNQASIHHSLEIKNKAHNGIYKKYQNFKRGSLEVVIFPHIVRQAEQCRKNKESKTGEQNNAISSKSFI